MKYQSIFSNDDRIINWYLFGSRLYGSNRENSDYDYIVVCYNDVYDSVILDYDDINVHIFSTDMFIRKIENMDIVALECLFSNNIKQVKYNFIPNFNNSFDEYNIRKFASTISSNSYVKGKRKLIVTGDYDLDIGLKSIFHSFRILDYAIQVVRNKKITNWTKYNYILDDLYEMSKKYMYDELWQKIDDKYRASYNELKHELKLIAPKQTDDETYKWLKNFLNPYNVEDHKVKEIINHFKNSI